MRKRETRNAYPWKGLFTFFFQMTTTLAFIPKNFGMSIYMNEAEEGRFESSRDIAFPI
jgi:hypothetical protein